MKTMKIKNVLAIFIFVIAFANCAKKNDTPEPTVKSSHKNIKSFTFNDFNPVLQAIIDTSAKTISISLPPSTDPSSLKPTIQLYDTKSTVSPSSQSTNNFLKSQTYRVTAEDGSIADYNTIIQKPAASEKDTPTPPKYLCIYYAWPSVVNGSAGNTTSAINVFKNYDIIIFGGGLWETTHSDYANTKTIINGLKSIKPSIKIFGYIDVGVTTQNLTIQQLQTAIDGWKLMAVDGVFGDDFDLTGSQVSRSRQNAFISYAHSKSLAVFANGWNIEEVLGGSDCLLSGTYNDYFLMESYFVSDGSYTSLLSNIEKANKAYFYMKKKGIGIACVARDLLSNLSSISNQSDKFKQSWHGTAMYNFDAFQYTDSNFSSPSGTLTYFQNPTTTYGTSWNDFDWVRKESDTKFVRSTNTTTIYISGDGTTNGSGGH